MCVFYAEIKGDNKMLTKNHKLLEVSNIFEYYKKKFNLKTYLCIREFSFECAYDYEENIIIYGLDYIKYIIQKGYIQEKFNIKDEDVFAEAILHEIGHAIDWTKNKEKCKQEITETVMPIYYKDLMYHDSRPFEIRAGKFTEREIKRWTDD